MKSDDLVFGEKYSGVRSMSSVRGRSMRSRVEKRMQKESGRTLTEIRRAKTLRKKLMTEEERLIFNLRRVRFFHPFFVHLSYLIFKKIKSEMI